jgi:hypothetical protein
MGKETKELEAASENVKGGKDFGRRSAARCRDKVQTKTERMEGIRIKE